MDRWMDGWIQRQRDRQAMLPGTSPPIYTWMDGWMEIDVDINIMIGAGYR